MLSAGQTLVNKKTRKLARLATKDDGPWAWDIGDDTAFVDEKGAKFSAPIKDYTHIEDEFGRPYSNQPKKGQFVDESAKKYLISKEEMLKLRTKSLLEKKKISKEIESRILLCAKEMKDNSSEDVHWSKACEHIFFGRALYSADLNEYYINQYFDFIDWFMRRHNAKGILGKNRFLAYVVRLHNKHFYWNCHSPSELTLVKTNIKF